MTQTQQTRAAESLASATNSNSIANYAAIFSGFMEKGIAAEDITPRVNVFTFNAWRALGRTVRKGEHGVKVVTWVSMTKKVETAEGFANLPLGRKPKTTTVFHVSQTEALATENN